MNTILMHIKESQCTSSSSGLSSIVNINRGVILKNHKVASSRKYNGVQNKFQIIGLTYRSI